MPDDQPPKADTKRKRNLNPEINGTLKKLVFTMLSIAGAIFLLMAGILGNVVLDAMKANTRRQEASAEVQEALAERLHLVEKDVIAIQSNLFTSVEGLQLELRLTQRISEAVETLATKIEGIKSQNGENGGR